MQKKGRGKKPKARKPLFRNKMIFRKFLFMVVCIVGCFLVVGSVAAFGYIRSVNAAAKPYFEHAAQVKPITPVKDSQDNDKNKDDEAGLLLPPRKTNFLVFGLDDEASLTDTMLVGCFDRETKNIDLISLPRDTYTVLSKEMISDLQKAGHRPPSSGVLKLNAVYNNAGKDVSYLKREVEELLGIKIDYYASVDLDAFRSVVDAVGGVDMVIPKGGFYYNDPTQNLVINIPEGPQHLNGKKAEGVVRFRATYARGDIQRIEMQQTFLKELFKQTLNKDTIINNAPALISNILTYVKTDFGVSDVPKYLRYVKDLNSENLNTHTLPGEAGYVNEASYFFHDVEQTQELVQEIFYSTDKQEDESPSDDENATTAVDIAKLKSLRIQILNGGIVEGMAAKHKALLEEEGLSVLNIDTYTGQRKNYTRIVVKNKATGQPFLHFYPAGMVEEDANLPAGYDVVIIIGTDET